MKTLLPTLLLTAGMLFGSAGFAQPPVANPVSPAASTAMPPAMPAATPTVPAKSVTAKPTDKVAPATGGGDGKVWVNSASKTYHCAGTKYYGKTKAGEYMSEADAKAKGNHPNHKKVCS